MAGDFVVAQPHQWKLFSWSGPRKQGFLFAVENSRRVIGMLIFQRRKVIGRSMALSRIFFNKPVPKRLVAEKTHGLNSRLVNRKEPKLPQASVLKGLPITLCGRRDRQAAQAKAKDDAQNSEHNRVGRDEPNQSERTRQRVPKKHDREENRQNP